MRHESRFERFEVTGPDGKQRRAEFGRAGILTAGDHPELYFFRVDGDEVVVGISGSALRRFEQGRRRMSREEKIDLAGLILERRIAAGEPLDSQNLFLQGSDLAQGAAELGIEW